jgi:hypothetical protein
VRKISTPPEFHPRTFQPASSPVKRLKISGFYICRQHYSAVSNRNHMSQQLPIFFYFRYVRAASQHRPAGSNSSIHMRQQLKICKVYVYVRSITTCSSDKVRVNTSEQLKVYQVFLANKRANTCTALLG